MARPSRPTRPGVSHVNSTPSAVLLTDEVADRTLVVAVGHHRGGAGVDSELVFERGAAEIVARAERAVRVDQVFGNDEQRDPARPLRRALDPGQHRVDDVLGHVVLAPGDEDLLAGDAVTVAVAHRAGPERADIGPGMGLGQVHRPRPFAAHQFGQPGVLLLGRTVDGERPDRALGQHRAQAEGEVGGVPDFPDRGRDQPWHALPAVFGLRDDAVPSAVGELPVGLGESVGRGDDAVLELAALQIARPVERGQHLRAELAGLGQHRAHQVLGHPIETG